MKKNANLYLFCQTNDVDWLLFGPRFHSEGHGVSHIGCLHSGGKFTPGAAVPMIHWLSVCICWRARNFATRDLAD